MDNKSQKMAEWPMFKLIYSMSIPAVFSMFIQALYNIVDSMYIARLSEDALFAMGLVFPLQMIGLSLALGGAIGCATLVSRRLGQKRKEEASATATTGLVLSVIHMIIVSLVGILFSKAFLSMFTSDNKIIGMGYDYLSIVMGINMGMFIEVFFSRLQQSQGNMILPMISQLIGAITNIILDPIFIFGGLGIAAMGVKGAAIATVIGQIVSAIFTVLVNVFGKHEVSINFKNFIWKNETVKNIYEVGLPVAIMNALGSVTTTAMNAVLVSYSQVAVTTLSIYFKLQSFVFMPIFGFNQGTLPILSYNFGAMNFNRYKEAVKIYIGSTIAIMTLGVILFWSVPNALLALFEPSNELLISGNAALKIISISFPVVGVSIVMTTVFQSLGKGFDSMIMSLSRQLLFLVPPAFIFGKLWGVNAVWFSYPFAEICVFIIFLPLCIKTVKKAFGLVDNKQG